MFYETMQISWDSKNNISGSEEKYSSIESDREANKICFGLSSIQSFDQNNNKNNKKILKKKSNMKGSEYIK